MYGLGSSVCAPVPVMILITAPLALMTAAGL